MGHYFFVFVEAAMQCRRCRAKAKSHLSAGFGAAGANDVYLAVWCVRNLHGLFCCFQDCHGCAVKAVVVGVGF